MDGDFDATLHKFARKVGRELQAQIFVCDGRVASGRCFDEHEMRLCPYHFLTAPLEGVALLSEFVEAEHVCTNR